MVLKDETDMDHMLHPSLSELNPTDHLASIPPVTLGDWDVKQGRFVKATGVAHSHIHSTSKNEATVLCQRMVD